MKTLALTFLLSLIFFGQTLAQKPFPPAFEIKTDTIGTITLPVSNWQYAKDMAAIWTIDSVRQSSVADKFHINTPENQDNSDHLFNFWVRYRLKNTMGREAHIALSFLPAYQCDIYLFESNGNKSHFVNGSLIPWSKRDGLKLYSNTLFGGGYIPVSISGGDELTVYIRRIHERGFGIQPTKFFIRLFSIEKMNSEWRNEEDTNYLKTIKNTVFFGILLWVAIFNLFFFSVVKERVYLYFAFYVFFLGLQRFNTSLFHLFFRGHPLLFNPIFTYFLGNITVFFIAHFIRNLLKTYLYFPLWDKLLLTFNTLYLIVLIPHGFFLHKILSPKWVSYFSDIIVLNNIILNILLLATLVLFVRKPEKSNRNMMIALLPPFVTWTVCLSVLGVSLRLERTFGIPYPFFYNWLNTYWDFIEIICLLWMVVYFSWTLLEKFNELRKQLVQKELEKEIERSQLIAVQKDKLEIQVEQRTHELKLSLDNLKSTQAQLIQSEKLASLGELTAGIAHEIQNPLNFVNNFSEVSVELMQELKSPLTPDGGILTGKRIDMELFSDITENLEKITLHGKRASSIVKGMLEHSRTSTGEKELTDINALADEYLRLAYHGLRAKDPRDSANKNFNSDFKTDFDSDLPKINIIPQDIGRVLLNLINNAFYAVRNIEKPLVTLVTEKSDNQIIIKVKDNGAGMSKEVQSKIFQPFFTTKPTGQGTGLGLSLA